ncbi:MAG: type II secretion system major pseudopilin GspG [Pirellulaceae bacterium]
MQKRTHRRRPRGFTLMEILLVLAILVVLGSLVTVGYVTVQRNAMMDAARTQIKMLDDAVDQYRLSVGKYPSGDQGLQSLRVQPPDAAANKWRGPYLEADIPVDPWGNDYIYEEVQDQYGEPSFQITSLGPDGTNGTADDIRLVK